MEVVLLELCLFLAPLLEKGLCLRLFFNFHIFGMGWWFLLLFAFPSSSCLLFWVSNLLGNILFRMFSINRFNIFLFTWTIVLEIGCLLTDFSVIIFLITLNLWLVFWIYEDRGKFGGLLVGCSVGWLAGWTATHHPLYLPPREKRLCCRLCVSSPKKLLIWSSMAQNWFGAILACI